MMFQKKNKFELRKRIFGIPLIIITVFLILFGIVVAKGFLSEGNFPERVSYFGNKNQNIDVFYLNILGAPSNSLMFILKEELVNNFFLLNCDPIVGCKRSISFDRKLKYFKIWLPSKGFYFVKANHEFKRILVSAGSDGLSVSYSNLALAYE